MDGEGAAMRESASKRMGVRLRRVAAALGLAVCAVPAAGQQPAPTLPTIPAPGVPVPTAAKLQPHAEPKAEVAKLTLGECIAIAVEKQPALRAVRSSQDATNTGQRALNNIGRVGSLFSPDLPIRKQQSERGVIAAAADVQKLHNEVVHDVTRLYYTVVYARQQEEFINRVVAKMREFIQIAKDLLESTTPGDMTPLKLHLMKLGLADALKLQADATAGVKQAEAALQEVMGVQNGGFEFRVADEELPIMAQDVTLTKDQVVDMALARRPELALAAAAADAFRLEVYAQGSLRFKRAVPTLGSASDIHSRLLPPGSRDPGKDYRPEPIPPEMPPQVVGSKQDRVDRVLAYSHRADAVFEKARNLIILEAEKSFFDYEKASKQLSAAKAANAEAMDALKLISAQFSEPKAPKDLLLMGFAQSSKAIASNVEATFNYLQTLAALERVTAGGVRPAFKGR
ncbi:MAG: TolC family protein [Gemmataceae bacterium]